MAKEMGEGGLGATKRVGGLQGALGYHRDGEGDAGIFGTTELQEGGPGGAGVPQHRERDSGGPQRERKGVLGHHGHGVRGALGIQRYHRDEEMGCRGSWRTWGMGERRKRGPGGP